MAWNIPDNFEEICVQALLCVGAVPRLVTDGGNACQSPEAKKFRRETRKFFLHTPGLIFIAPRWSPHYAENYVRFLANKFIKWCSDERAITSENS